MAKLQKRTLDDFFGSSTARDFVDPAESHGRITTFNKPVGLSLIHDLITVGEEEALLAFLDRQEWRTDLARRTKHYGGDYCLMPPRDASPDSRKRIERTILTAPSIPPDMASVVDKMVARGLYKADERPGYCIVNEYRPGQGISAHVENFRFGEPVCSLTLAGGDVMRFHEMKADYDGSVRSGKAAQAPRTGEHVDVFMPRRSVLVLTGDARRKWQHEIVRGKSKGKAATWRRVSLTFRVDQS